MEDLDPNYADALVVSVRMINTRVRTVMIDTSSSTDILYLTLFKNLGSWLMISSYSFFTDGVHE